MCQSTYNNHIIFFEVCILVLTLTNFFENNCSFTWNIRFRTCPDRAYRKLNIKKTLVMSFSITLRKHCKNNYSFTWNIPFRTCPDRAYRKLNIPKKPRKCRDDFRNNQSVLVISNRNIFSKKQLCIVTLLHLQLLES